MELFGAGHAGMLVFSVVVCVLAVWGARRIRGTGLEHRVTRCTGWGLLLLSLVWMGWGWLPQSWDIDESLPFHLSDVLRVVTAVALIARPGWAICLAYYWGLTLNLQSLITPDLNYVAYPLIEFTMYWLLHIVVFVTPVVFTFGLGYRPTWAGYILTYAATALWAGTAAAVNLITGTNYGYLSRAPEGASLLDALGPWPIYILWEATLIAAVWALMTWPWTTAGNRHTIRTGRQRASGLIRRAGTSVSDTTVSSRSAPR